MNHTLPCWWWWCWGWWWWMLLSCSAFVGAGARFLLLIVVVLCCPTWSTWSLCWLPTTAPLLLLLLEDSLSLLRLDLTLETRINSNWGCLESGGTPPLLPTGDLLGRLEDVVGLVELTTTCKVAALSAEAGQWLPPAPLCANGGCEAGA